MTSRGQQWLDKAKTCLQAKITEALSKLDSEPTCKQIEEAGFGAHTDCYVDSGFCNIGIDWPRIVSIMHSSLFSDKWKIVWGQVLAVAQKCVGNVFG